MVMPRDMFIDWQEEKYGLCLLEQVKLGQREQVNLGQTEQMNQGQIEHGN